MVSNRLFISSEFDEQGFVSGIQLMADSYANVVQAGGNGQVRGIGNVKTVKSLIFAEHTTLP